MTDVRIKSIDISSYSLDDRKPPNGGTITVEVGGHPLRLTLSQERIDELVASALPMTMDVLREVSDTLNARSAA